MAVASSPINDHLSAQIPRFEVRIDGSITPCVWHLDAHVKADGNAYQRSHVCAQDLPLTLQPTRCINLSNYWSQTDRTLKPPQSVLVSQRLFILHIDVMEEYIRAYLVYLFSGVFGHVPGCENDYVKAS
jgi:hypothetical protein